MIRGVSEEEMQKKYLKQSPVAKNCEIGASEGLVIRIREAAKTSDPDSFALKMTIQRFDCKTSS